MIMDNLQINEVDPDVADAIDFMVERVLYSFIQIVLNDSSFMQLPHLFPINFDMMKK